MKFKQFINKAGFELKKHSPEILMVAGVVGVVGSTVMACKATLKAKDILSEAKKNAEDIKLVASDPELSNGYSEEDLKKDSRINVIQTGVKLAKVYTPAVILGGLSLTAIITSNNILRKRNMALAAAYATIDKSFKEYRERVKERYGEEAEYEIHHNISKAEITEVDENGKETKTSIDIKDGDLSDYADYYTKETAKGCSRDIEYNKMAIRATAESITYTLKAKGVLTLNEVRDALGMEPTKAGMVVGWIYDEQNPTGDNRVEIYTHEVFKDGEKVLLIDFNCDGNVYNNM